MERVCSKCKKNIAEGPKDISFSYDGFDFTIFKNGLTCFECAKNDHVESFEEFGRKFIKKEGNKIKVDWQAYIDVDLKIWPDMEDSILTSLGILSYNPKGNWEITSDGTLSMNPRRLYFTNKDDVITFARLKYSNTLYKWEIKHIDEVLTRKEVLK